MPARSRSKNGGKRTGQGDATDITRNNYDPLKWMVDNFHTTVILLMVAAYFTILTDGLTYATARIPMTANVRAAKKAAPTLELAAFFSLVGDDKTSSYDHVLFPHHLFPLLLAELQSEAPDDNDARTQEGCWNPEANDNTTADCVNMITERQSRCSRYEHEYDTARPALVDAQMAAKAAVQETDDYAPAGAHVALTSALASAEDALRRNTEATMKLKQQVSCDKALLAALLTYDRAMKVWDHKTTPSEYDKQKPLTSFSNNDNHITLEEWRTKTPLYRYNTWKYAQINSTKYSSYFWGAATRDITTAIAFYNQGLILWNAITNEMVPRTQARMIKRTELNEMKHEMKSMKSPDAPESKRRQRGNSNEHTMNAQRDNNSAEDSLSRKCHTGACETPPQLTLVGHWGSDTESDSDSSLSRTCTWCRRFKPTQATFHHEEDCWAAHKAWLLTLVPEIPWRRQGESDTESDTDKSANEVPAAARAACESPPTQRQSDKTLISTKWLYKVKPSTRAHWGSTDEKMT